MQHSIKYLRIKPNIDIGFWHSLYQAKLEQFKLDNSIKEITGTYKISNFSDEGKAYIYLDAYSITQGNSQQNKALSGPVELTVKGYLVMCNTIEEFKNYKTHNLADDVWQRRNKEILNQNSYDAPFTFIFICYGDLKYHIYSYNFAVLIPDFQEEYILGVTPIKEHFSSQKLDILDTKLRTFIEKEYTENGNLPHFWLYEDNEQQEGVVYKLQQQQQQQSEGTYVGLIDQNNEQDKISTGLWNGFYTLKKSGLFQDQEIYFIVIKDFIVKKNVRKINFKNSVVLKVNLAQIPESVSYRSLQFKEPITVNLRSFLDEHSLSSQAIDLNVKLMKWRMMPELDIPKIQNTKCLLIGAGTLGCQLSRNLIGWGVRHITFIDYGKVAYSNPVRQSLYDFEDTINGGKQKAQAAAAKLIKIFPEVKSVGYEIEIPMPGHYPHNEEKRKQVFESIEILEHLVQTHDIVYLLTDSRESRWLPTILCNLYKKICFTVALGFDSFLVMRHGISTKYFQSDIHLQRLGCYFCNDVQAPHNSFKDRTLDQQCTVTRPGLSFISSAYASELMVSLIHHPLLEGAPAFEHKKDLQETCMGILPHHIRGTLSDFETRLFYAQAFDNCVACSSYILNEYEQNKEDLIMKVLENPDYLQKIAKIENLLEMEDDDCIAFD